MKTKSALDSLDNFLVSVKESKCNFFILKNKYFFDQIIDFMVWQFRRHPDLKKELVTKYTSFFSDRESVDEAVLDTLGSIGDDDNGDFRAILNKKNKTLYYIESEEMGFITTDEPVIRFNKSESNGIGIVSTEIYFPLSSKVLLCLSEVGGEELMMLMDDNEKLMQLNSYIARKAKKYIFASTKEQIDDMGIKVK